MKGLTVICLVVLILLSSCEENGEFGVLEESNFELLEVDTLSLDISTVHVDSLVTQGTQNLLLGQWNHPDLGQIRAQNYFQFSLGSELTIDDEDIYDSLGIIIYPYGENYGLPSSQRIGLYRIAQDYEPREDYFYQFDSLEATSEALGYFELDFDAEEDDSVFIKIENGLGQEIFQKAIDHDDEIETDFNFREYLRGFVLRPEDAQGDFISTIPFNGNRIKLMLYYSESVDSEIVQIQKQFPLGSQNNQFNQIQTEDDNSLISKIIDNSSLPIEATNRRAYVQGSSALVTKVRIPGINNINALFEDFIITSAVLEIVPVRNSFDDDTPLPGFLAVYYQSKFQNLNETLRRNSPNPRNIGSVIFDSELEQNTRYEIDVLPFFNDLMINQGLNDESLYITLPDSLINSETTGIVIDGSANATKLKVLITKYND